MQIENPSYESLQRQWKQIQDKRSMFDGIQNTSGSFHVKNNARGSGAALDREEIEILKKLNEILSETISMIERDGKLNARSFQAGANLIGEQEKVQKRLRELGALPAKPKATERFSGNVHVQKSLEGFLAVKKTQEDNKSKQSVRGS